MINRLGAGMRQDSSGLQGLRPFSRFVAIASRLKPRPTKPLRSTERFKLTEQLELSSDSSPLQEQVQLDVGVHDCELVRACRESCVGLLATEYRPDVEPVPGPLPGEFV